MANATTSPIMETPIPDASRGITAGPKEAANGGLTIRAVRKGALRRAGGRVGLRQVWRTTCFVTSAYPFKKERPLPRRSRARMLCLRGMADIFLALSLKPAESKMQPRKPTSRTACL